jgi:hypothetical protein
MDHASCESRLVVGPCSVALLAPENPPHERDSSLGSVPAREKCGLSFPGHRLAYGVLTWGEEQR